MKTMSELSKKEKNHSSGIEILTCPKLKYFKNYSSLHQLYKLIKKPFSKRHHKPHPYIHL